MAIHLTLIIEDVLSEAVARKLLGQANQPYAIASTLFWNKDKIIRQINGINQSAKGHVYFVLTDQDTQSRCPPDALAELSAPLHQNLAYRFAVMETEAWLLAHRAAIAKFLSVAANKISAYPETIGKPKEYLVALARNSRSSAIRREIVPAAGSTSRIGPNYNDKLIRFVKENWNVNIASQSSPSLRRAFAKLQSFTPSASIPQSLA